MANVLGELFGEIAEAIRGKTGDSGKMKPAEFPQKISAIKTAPVLAPLEITENGTYTAPAGVGGYNPVTVAVAGSSAELRYVTFLSYDGSFEYGKKAVAVGDDCADPIARGIFATPTRESDAQYTYTFYGWATTPNGAADSNALKAVNEDRTVYANFSAAVRYYTITYYDSDGTTVLKTESLAYGAMPSYKPEKEGFVFSAWNPALSAVTGNASYTATWSEKLTFADATWADIARISTEGNASTMFAIGDTKKFTTTLANGKQAELELVIVDFDYDNLADGSGKAGISMVFAPAIGIANSTTGDSKDLVPAGSTAVIPTNGKAYVDQQLRYLVNSRLLWLLPSDLQSVIKTVTKESKYYQGQVGTSEEKVWVVSEKEMSYSSLFPANGGYKYFESDDRRKKKGLYGNTDTTVALTTSNVTYNTRDASQTTAAFHYTVKSNGQTSSASGFANESSYGNFYFVGVGLCI